MRWRGMRQSDNIEDRRGRTPAMAMGGGLSLLVVIVVSLIFGINPMQLLQSTPDVGGSGRMLEEPRQSYDAGPEAKSQTQFVSTVLASTEDVWTGIFSRSGKRYVEPRLVLFNDQVESACGYASSAVGPFYCSGDNRVYLDTAFFDELDRRFGAPGDFAQAYVIAHEIGHHVQNLLGISGKVHSMQRGMSEADANALSVRLELQADFFAGVWAHHAQQTHRIIEPGDFDEAIRAASAIGDDRLQKQARGFVVPDSFTHGTSAQRVRWFRKGFDSGEPSDGDTFATDDL